MDKGLNNFKKKHDYIICFDSDGTVLDAMNIKHNKCHGPSLIEVFELEEYKEDIQKIWNRINLFDKSRGVNRFHALLAMLNEINGKYINIDENSLKVLSDYVNSGRELSSAGLKREIEITHDPLLEKALIWSNKINEKIQALSPKDKPPFEGVIEFLKHAYGKLDIGIVSSSNMSAIIEEWDYYSLLDYIDVITSQEVGTKKDCIKNLLDKGYEKNHILMCGDALPDVDAAKENGVLYYPILINNEKHSWEELKNKYLDVFLNGDFELHQKELLNSFEENFSNI